MENNQNDSLIFVDGMNFQQVPANAPEVVRGKISFKIDKFKDFLTKHTDDRGWLNIKMMKSKKDGNIYFILDTWKPQARTAEAQDYNDNKYKVENKHITSPSPEHPNGIDVYNHQFTTDKEREQMDKEDELLSGIPF